MAKQYKIHPAIGVARLGDSPTGWFIGPESPGALPDLSDPNITQPANGRYKDAGGIKRQGARFRIYEYDDAGGAPTPVREITHAEAEITWSVHLGNRKAAGPRIFEKGDRNVGVARERLIIDAGRQQIAGASAEALELAGSFQGAHTAPVPVPLGTLRTDAAGRLIVFGGFGKSFSPTNTAVHSTFNNEDWCDDTSDGPVTASLRLRDTGQLVTQVEAAWVLVGPPDFAPPIGNVISLYDIVYDTAQALFRVHLDPLLAAGRCSFTQHIYPILRRAADIWWVDESAFGHAPGAGGDFLDAARFALLQSNNQTLGSPERRAREGVVSRLRRPDGSGGNMPELNAEFDTGRAPRLTPVQFELMQRWARGEFEADWQGADPRAAPVVPLAQVPLAEQPFSLDKAALGACVGASFYPGIEAPRVFRDRPTSRQFPRGVYAGPFRLLPDLPPGALTQGLAVPWQTDFAACGSGWWPAQRPNDVFRNGVRAGWADGASNFVEDWRRLGFVVPGAGDILYAETERA